MDDGLMEGQSVHVQLPLMFSIYLSLFNQIINMNDIINSTSQR